MNMAFVCPTPLLRALPRSSKQEAAPRSGVCARRAVTATQAHPRTSTGSRVAAYNDWVDNRDPDLVEQSSSTLNAAISFEPRTDTAVPPEFEPFSLFHAGAEEYAAKMTTPPSDDFALIADRTAQSRLFAPCMVGAIEGQFLKMVTQIKNARRVLDVGTFTGYSALSFADALAELGGADDGKGKVVTIEADVPTAAVARDCFRAARNGGLIELVEDDAQAAMKRLCAMGEKFDIVFLDADKVSYTDYYELGIAMLETDGILMADNALCSLVYKEDDPARPALHDFAQHVRADPRVEQVMLTVREGILIVRKV